LNIIGSIKKKEIYAIFSPRAVIKIERKIKVATLLDTGADINVITVKIADAVNLPILEIIPIEAEIFTGYNI
jgi:predicted aspartyl protease